MASDGVEAKMPGNNLRPGTVRELVDETAANLIEVAGVIKWFDVAKGFGFIIPDNGMPDVLLHVTCLRRDGFQTAYEGARVVCEVLQLPKGLQAFRVLSMDETTGVHAFSVELVENDADREKGLMFRKELPEGRGMLFDFHREQDVSFWMENTYIPLDMIFIRGDGRILRIAENTEPLSTRMIPSGGPVRAVLEVIGGTARKLGIAPGDRVGHPIFKTR